MITDLHQDADGMDKGGMERTLTASASFPVPHGLAHGFPETAAEMTTAASTDGTDEDFSSIETSRIGSEQAHSAAKRTLVGRTNQSTLHTPPATCFSNNKAHIIHHSSLFPIPYVLISYYTD